MIVYPTFSPLSGLFSKREIGRVVQGDGGAEPDDTILISMHRNRNAIRSEINADLYPARVLHRDGFLNLRTLRLRSRRPKTTTTVMTPSERATRQSVLRVFDFSLRLWGSPAVYVGSFMGLLRTERERLRLARS